MTPAEIKDLRLSRNQSQEAFAHDIGVSVFTIFKWEHGICKPHRSFVRDMRKMQIK